MLTVKCALLHLTSAQFAVTLASRYLHRTQIMLVKPLIVEVGAEVYDQLLIFGGAYSNLQAVESLLEVAGQLSLSPQQIVCTGDSVAYCGDPELTLRALRTAGIWHIKGNCEQSLSRSDDDCGCGFAEGTLCSALSRAWFRYADSEVTPELRHWMAGLPDGLILRFAGRHLTIAHGTPQSINRFVFRSTPSDEKAAELDTTGTDAIVVGHCGLPFTQILGGRVWHNSGALGMPANDGTPRTWFSLLSRTATGIFIQHRHLTYDYQRAADRMRQVGLPVPYADALLTGRWPSLDILPEAERQATGIAIEPTQYVWSGG